jgi:hypothetical protein
MMSETCNLHFVANIRLADRRGLSALVKEVGRNLSLICRKEKNIGLNENHILEYSIA